MTAIRRLREALGLNQIQWAQMLGKSYASIRNYEQGVPLPDDLVEKVVSIATQHGRADLAMELRGGKYAVKRVLTPEETLISTGRKRGKTTPEKDLGTPPATGPARRTYFHRLLDEVFDSANNDAITAVENNLIVFGRYVRRDAPRASTRRQKEA